jgi:hypothetical protein
MPSTPVAYPQVVSRTFASFRVTDRFYRPKRHERCSGEEVIGVIGVTDLAEQNLRPQDASSPTLGSSTKPQVSDLIGHSCPTRGRPFQQRPVPPLALSQFVRRDRTEGGRLARETNRCVGHSIRTLEPETTRCEGTEQQCAA